MPHKCLTGRDLIKEANVKSLQHIEELNLSDRSLGSIDSALFNKLSRLHTLDLSNNNLHEIPSDFRLLQLQTFDLSDNDLSSLQFVAHCPKLHSLYITGNKQLKADDVYIAAYTCPTLETSDCVGKSTACSLQASVHCIREKLSYKVHGVWDALFQDNIRETNFTDHDREQLLQNFVAAFEKQKIWDTNSLMKFQRYVVHCLAEEIVDSLGSDTKLEAFKRKPKRSLKTIQEDENYEESPPKRAKHNKTIPEGSSAKKTKSSRSEKKIRFTKLKSRPLPKTSFDLPPVKDYSPVHFVRCHSYNNDPSDNRTKVWKCAFEPNPDNPAKTTNIVGSCGGQIVSLLDCRTGKVMRRYKDDTEEESFYCLAWTTVTMMTDGSKRPTNLLAVAGEGAGIKLMHPEQLLVYGVLRGHKKAVQCLAFHPDQPTYLFSGSDGNCVFLWDIGIPDPVTYETRHSRLLSLQTQGSGVLNLAFSGSLRWLVAACEEGCYGWNLNSYTKDIRLPTLEFCLPEMDDDTCSVDGLAILPNDIVATKCIGQATIYLWQLNDHVTEKLYKSTRAISIDALCGLSYPLTDTPYINLHVSSGLLVVGDTKGSVLMYNLKEFLDKDSWPEGSCSSCSRELKWPLLCGDNERQMLDSDLEQVVINMAALSSDVRYLVAGTDNNLLCVWQRD